MALHRALLLVAGATLFLTTQANAAPKSEDPCEQICFAALKSCEKTCNNPATKTEEACDTPCIDQEEKCEKRCPHMLAKAKNGSLGQPKTKLKRPEKDGLDPTVNIDK
jgi:hypothetical protein